MAHKPQKFMSCFASPSPPSLDDENKIFARDSVGGFPCSFSAEIFKFIHSPLQGGHRFPGLLSSSCSGFVSSDSMGLVDVKLNGLLQHNYC